MTHPAPAQPVQQIPATGAIGWWLFFLSYIPIPLVGLAVWIGLAWREHKKLRHEDTPRATNARNALNWAITFHAFLAVIFAVAIILMVITVPLIDSGRADESLASVILIPFLVAIVWTIIAWVHAIAGGLAAGKGRPYKAAFTIPFFREQPAGSRRT